MTLGEYKEQLEKLRAKHADETNTLMFAYAKSNQRFKCGDKIRARGGDICIIVNKIRWERPSSFNGHKPQIVYHGVMLTKQMEPRKDGQTAVIAERYAEEA